MVVTNHYASNHTARPGRARPPPRPGGAAGLPGHQPTRRLSCRACARAVATPTTRRLADASISRNTRRAYLGALARLDAWRGAAPVDDRPPRCARTGSPRFSPPPNVPARTAGASNPTPRRTAGADSTP